MGWWDTVKDIGGAIASPVYGAYQLGNAASGGGLEHTIFGSQFDPNRNNYADRDYMGQVIRGQIGSAGGRPAPQAGMTNLAPTQNLDMAQQNQFREREMALANNLQRVMSGQQAGAGELAVNRQTGQALNQAYGAATMGRGNNAAGAAREAARAAAGIGIGGAGMAAQAQLSDQQAAGQLLSGVLGQGRAQDVNIAGQNAAAGNTRSLQQGSMDQAIKIENIRAQLAQQGLNDQQIQAMLAQMGLMNSNELAGRSQDNGIIGGLIATGGQAAAMASDERVKTAVTDASSEVDAALSSIKPYRYEYIDPKKHGEGSRVGVMAQDLAKSKAGANVVTSRDGVLMLDLGKATSLTLAGMGRLADRLGKVEAQIAGK